MASNSNFLFMDIAPPVVFDSMFRNCRNPKILYPIIEFITVNMMNCFFRIKSSSKVFFHYLSVFTDYLSIVMNCYITRMFIRLSIWSNNSMQSSINMKSFIVHITHTLCKTRVFTTLHLTNIRWFSVRTLDSINPSILTKQHIMVLAKTFCELRLIAILNLTSKIFDTIKASTQLKFSPFAKFFIMNCTKTSAKICFVTFFNRTFELLFHTNNIKYLLVNVKFYKK